MEDVTVVDLLRQRAQEIGDKLFIWCGKDQLTYGQLDACSDRVAAALASWGVGPGDHVATLSVNRAELVELYFACPKIGAVQVPLNAFIKGEFLRYQLADSSATTLVVDRAGFEAVAGLVSTLPELRRVVVFDPVDASGCPVPVIGYEEMRSFGGPLTAAEHTAGHLMSIIYTSGTTGLPKGCELTAGYYVRVGRAICDFIGLRADDTMLTAAPLFHAGARTMGVASILATGATLVVEPEFHSSTFLERAVETGATVVLGVGAIAKALLARPHASIDRTHSLRLAVCVPADVELQDLFEERFGVPVFTQIYGQTECTPVTYAPASAPLDRAGAGRASADVEIRLVDDDDRDVAAGAVGELVLRPRHPHAMFSGYWRKPEETLRAFRGLWYHTGDYCRMGPDGTVYFVDRKRDSLRRRGENISSVELENAIGKHPKVAQVAVHAVPSDMTDDEIKACVVAVDGELLSPAELFAFFRDHLPYFAIPRYVEVLPELPRNAMERVMKPYLRERGITEDTWDLHGLGFEVERAARR